MSRTLGRPQQRTCRAAEIGLSDDREFGEWSVEGVRLASIGGPDATRYLLTVPDAVLEGEALTRFLARVSPFGCPSPGSLIRAYSLPDAPHPSILLREHEEAPDGLADAYRRFLDYARRHWLAALQETGPGLCPFLAWEVGSIRRFLALDEWPAILAQAGVALAAGIPDDYLGRGLLLLADPYLADSWQTMMSLGGVTKARRITGREFPVWVDLPSHQPALLASPLLGRAERILMEE